MGEVLSGFDGNAVLHGNHGRHTRLDQCGSKAGNESEVSRVAVLAALEKHEPQPKILLSVVSGGLTAHHLGKFLIVHEDASSYRVGHHDCRRSIGWAVAAMTDKVQDVITLTQRLL